MFACMGVAVVLCQGVGGGGSTLPRQRFPFGASWFMSGDVVSKTALRKNVTSFNCSDSRDSHQLNQFNAS